MGPIANVVDADVAAEMVNVEVHAEETLPEDVALLAALWCIATRMELDSMPKAWTADWKERN